MIQYIIELMALIKFGNPGMQGEELELAANELFVKIKNALDENRERQSKIK